MSDLSITANNVLAATTATIKRDKVAGEAVTGGQVVYLKAADSKWYKAQHDGTLAESEAVGIVLNTAGAGQPVHVITEGDCTIGATVAVGETYLVSATAGGIAPYADIGAGDYVTVVGVGTTAAVLKVKMIVSGIQKA